MKTRIKLLAVLASATAIAASAGAQIQERPARNDRQPAGFNCPTCGSPCISKAQAVRLHRQVNARQQQFRTNPQVPLGQNGPRANLHQPRRNNPQARMQQRDNLRNRQPQDGVKRNRQQQSLRFDLDGDGTLSPAERAALKAYRNELRKQHGEKPDQQQPLD